MKEIIKIKETCLYIQDLQGAHEFYHLLLGFPVIDYVHDKHLFLRVGSSVLLCFNPDDSAGKSSPLRIMEGANFIWRLKSAIQIMNVPGKRLKVLVLK